MKKLLKALRNLKEIKTLDKNEFHVIKVDADTDYETMTALSEYLDSKKIMHLILNNRFDLKTLAAADKKELFSLIKKEIGLDEPEEKDNLITHPDGTLYVEISTKTDTRLKYNDLLIEYDEVTNVILISYELSDGKFTKYVLPVKEKGKPVFFKYKVNFGGPGAIEVYNMENIKI